MDAQASVGARTTRDVPCFVSELPRRHASARLRGHSSLLRLGHVPRSDRKRGVHVGMGRRHLAITVTEQSVHQKRVNQFP